MRRSVLWMTGLVLLGIGGLTTVQAKEFASRVPDSRVRGEELYNRHCVACHGDKGAGDGPMTVALVVPVPALDVAIPTRNIEPLVEVVMVGKGAMPGFARAFEDLYPWEGDFNDAARDVLKYMKSLSGEAAVSSKDGPITRDERDEEEEAARD